jgi:spermidine synthase
MDFQRSSLYGILFLSGFAGLGYEMVWTRMLSVGLGHEIVSVLAVVAAFFCGMAIGSWAMGLFSSGGRAAGRWYAAIETTIGCWSLVLVFLIPWANRFVTQWMGAEPSLLHHWTLSFLVPFVLLLPATLAMGGTLPLMSCVFQPTRASGSPIGGLYAANSFGAVAGTLLSTFLLVPRLGFRATLLAFAVLNFLCAVGVLCSTAGSIERCEPTTPRPFRMAHPAQGLVAAVVATGLLGIGYEVLIVRAVSQVLENTVYSFAGMLSVYLLGTATGAALYQRSKGRKPFDQTLSFLLASISGFCLLGTFSLDHCAAIHGALRSISGGGFAGSVFGEMGLAAAVCLLPAVAMGATFSHLAQKADAERMGFGGALCLNTLGASLAPLLFGVLLLPLLGLKTALIAVCLGYLALIPVSATWRYRPALVPLLAGAILMASPHSLKLVTLEPGDEILEHRDGVMASVTVVKDKHNEIHLKINNRFQMGGTSSVFSDRREGHIPLLLHPNPQKALFLGMGTGATLAAAADHPGLRAEGVELIPEVIPVLHHFERSTGNLHRLPQLSVLVADARRYVNCSSQQYDVIIADLFHPARDGAGSLYTREHFQAIERRLNPGGVFCQWLPLYQLDLDMLRVIVRTFLEVFPDGSAYLAHYSLKAPIIGLVAGHPSGGYPIHWWDNRTRDSGLRRSLEGIRLDSFYSLMGLFLAAKEDLWEFAGDAPINKDDLPVVTFGAPRFAYGEEQPAQTRLLALIDRFRPHPDEVLAPARSVEDQAGGQRLSAYLEARNLFIHAGVGVPQTSDARLLLNHARENLLAVVRISRDFSSAYNPLLTMARRLYPTEPAAAKQLLLELEEANPNRGDAKHVRQVMFGE